MPEQQAPWLALLVFSEGELPDDPDALGPAYTRLSLPQVGSWIADGANEPITPAQVTSAIGGERLSEFAEALGQSPEDLARKLAAELPGVVDSATADGPGRTGDKRALSTPDIMLCLFDEVPDQVVIREPGQGIHFGIGQVEAIRLD